MELKHKKWHRIAVLLCTMLLFAATSAFAGNKYQSKYGKSSFLKPAARPAYNSSYSKLKERVDALEQMASQSNSNQEEIRAEIEALRTDILALIGNDSTIKASYSLEQQVRIGELRAEQMQYQSDLEKLDLAVAGGLDPDLINSSINAIQQKIDAIDAEIEGMEPEVQEEQEATGLYARLYNLEKSYKRMQEKGKEERTEKETKIPEWIESVTLFGGVDVRVGYSTFSPEAKDADSESKADMFVDSVTFGLEFNPNDYIMGTFSIIWEEEFAGDDGTLELDEAFIRAHWKGLFAQVGREYIPVGQMDSYAATDPILVDIVECGQSAFGIGYEHDYFGVSGWVFNGKFDNVDDKGEAADDTFDNFAFRADIFPLSFQEKYSLALGGYYLSDATESSLEIGDSLTVVDPDGTADSGDEYTKYESNVPTYGVYLNAELPFTDMFGLGLIGEYVTTGEFDDTEYVDNTGEATAVTGMNFELAALIWDGRFQVGPKYETISGLDWLGTQDLDATYEVTSYSQFGGFVGYEPWDFMHLGIQYLTGSDNENNQASEFFFQTALEF